MIGSAKSIEDVLLRYGMRGQYEGDVQNAAAEIAKFWPEITSAHELLPASTAEGANTKIRVCQSKDEVCAFFSETGCDCPSAGDDGELARLRDLTSMRLSVGAGLFVCGSSEAIRRAQTYIMLDSNHPVEKSDNNRYLMRELEKAEALLAVPEPPAAVETEHDDALLAMKMFAEWVRREELHGSTIGHPDISDDERAVVCAGDLSVVIGTVGDLRRAAAVHAKLNDGKGET